MDAMLALAQMLDTCGVCYRQRNRIYFLGGLSINIAHEMCAKQVLTIPIKPIHPLWTKILGGGGGFSSKTLWVSPPKYVLYRALALLLLYTQ